MLVFLDKVMTWRLRELFFKKLTICSSMFSQESGNDHPPDSSYDLDELFNTKCRSAGHGWSPKADIDTCVLATQLGRRSGDASAAAPETGGTSQAVDLGRCKEKVFRSWSYSCSIGDPDGGTTRIERATQVAKLQVSPTGRMLPQVSPVLF